MGEVKCKKCRSVYIIKEPRPRRGVRCQCEFCGFIWWIKNGDDNDKGENHGRTLTV